MLAAITSTYKARVYKMKITKRQLRRIIKEEKARLLSEAPSSRATIYDMDNGQTLNLSARPEPHAGFISFSIGNSFRMALDPEDLDVIVGLL